MQSIVIRTMLFVKNRRVICIFITSFPYGVQESEGAGALIKHIHKHETMGWGAVAFKGAGGVEAFFEKGYGETAPGDFDKGAGDVADHMVEKRIALEFDAPEVVHICGADNGSFDEYGVVQGPDCRSGLVSGALKSREIVFSEQGGQQRLQEAEAGTVGDMPCERCAERIGFTVEINAVRVTLALGGKSCIKARGRFFKRNNADFRSKHFRECVTEAGGKISRPLAREDLSEGVYPRVGSRRAGDGDGVRSDLC